MTKRSKKDCDPEEFYRNLFLEYAQYLWTDIFVKEDWPTVNDFICGSPFPVPKRVGGPIWGISTHIERINDVRKFYKEYEKIIGVNFQLSIEQEFQELLV